mmetsp:Transcript_78154/g.117599  ORF Transcript_78154/g.117599 Transcript_78154/m.117599 type:complete len:95 (-) Transcript_78154:183-467(-)
MKLMKVCSRRKKITLKKTKKIKKKVPKKVEKIKKEETTMTMMMMMGLMTISLGHKPNLKNHKKLKVQIKMTIMSPLKKALKNKIHKIKEILEVK